MIYYFSILSLFTIVSILYVAVNDEGNFAGIATGITIMFFLMIWGASLIVYFTMR
jgi:hypothetical protein